jgi:hypothetical protein
MPITTFDDLDNFKAARGNSEEAPAPARVKRQLSPEFEKAVKDMSPLRAWARAAASKYTFGGADWLGSKLPGGTNVEDEREMSARIRELNPKASFAGDMTGGALQGMQASAGIGLAAPALAGTGLGAGMLREGLGSLALGGVDQAIEGKFDPESLVTQGALGLVLGGAGSRIPKAAGHGRSIAAGVLPRPMEAAERRAMDQAGQFGEHYGFRGPAALDVAQKARLSEAPDLQTMAANVERIKNRAGVAARDPQEAAFRANRLDRLMEDSVPQPGSPRGPSQGGLRDYPVMSGREVGQSHHAFPDTTVFTPPRPLPASAEAGIDDSFARNNAMWRTQMANRGTNRPQPQKYEFNQWEDILNRNKSRYPMHRDDVAATREIFGDVNPIMRNRMDAEQRAEDVARIRSSIRTAPATPDRIPDTIPLGISAGGPLWMRRFLPNISASVDVPVPKPTARYAKAQALLNDPDFLDAIGRMTRAQSATGGALGGAASGPSRR